LAAALLLGRGVRKALPAASPQHDAAGGEQTAVRPRINFSASLGVLDRAQKLLDESEEQLKERSR
jgi:chemotaxis protein MotC